MPLTGEPAAATTYPDRSSDPDRGERYIDWGRFFPDLEQYTQKLYVLVNGTYVECVIDDDDEEENDDEVPDLIACDDDENSNNSNRVCKSVSVKAKM
ncbi:hypothetical protein R3P38DRAFT_3236158 [Favolaschia claudopus]|uniref:Uncharacterized protein n=1 Tax=Favolaschia claudopus TaxID=2862362 RepID=A0AAV9ZDK8_9AGAR